MYNHIILKKNSVGKATTNKLTETVDGKNSSFRFSVKKIIWTTCGYAEAHLRNLEIFLLSERFFPLIVNETLFLLKIPVTFLSFGCLYLWILEIKSERYFYTLDFCIFNFTETSAAFLFSLFASFKYFIWVLFSYF